MSQPLFDPSPFITSSHHVVMAAGTDVEAVDQPVAPGDVKSQSISAQSTHMSMSHYLGLPYQDHNYGQPPPPTPPQSPPPTLDTIPVLPLTTIYENSNPSFTPPEDNVEAQKDEGVTRCICTFDHDDGYMICCDKCLVWQHVECMGLDRNNIPDVYFCERCEPRMVDQQRALELQTIKRKHILERLDSSDDDTKRKPKRTRYSSISNTPTSLTLTSTKGKNKMKKKKKKKEKEKIREKMKEEEKDQKQEKHHKKKKKKKQFDLILSSQRKHRKNRGRAEPGIGDLLLHGEQILDNSDSFVEAAENQYSTELNQYLSDQRQNAMWTMPSLGCILDDLSPQKIKLGATGRTARGLLTTEELAPNQPIVEYRGMLMLRDQFVPANGWTKKPYLHVLMYTKFSNIELCVDARKYGNIARYVRKSCSPNAEVRHVAIDGLLRLYLFSLVDISKGSEVTVAFDFSYKDCTHPVKCACSKKNCPVKRYWRKRRSLEARNQKKPTDRETSASSKRTVSPLRVSLSAANGAEKRVEQTIDHKDESKLGQEEKPPTSTNVSHHKSRSNRNSVEKATKEVVVDASSDNEHKEKVDVEAVDPPQPQDPNKEKSTSESSAPKEEEATPRLKMTREERKMEAIMKAFAKMEKAQERRQQALVRLSQSKPQEDNATTPSAGEDEKEKEIEQGESKKSDQQEEQSSLPSKDTNQVTQSDSASGKDEQCKFSDATTKEESSSNTVAPITTPLTSRKPRRRRRSTMSSRRRNRSNSITSAASASTSVEVSSADDDSNQAPPLLMGAEKSSFPSTPLSISTSTLGQEKGDAPLASPGSSSSKRFRFPKTKKFFMNEWLNEKAYESWAGKPLTIKTEQLDLSYSSNLSSPNTPLLQRSGSLSALVKETRNNPLESSGGLAGSAKKRWLRQAMSEGNSNQDPITCNGTVSPIASPALSPNTSASSDLMTPLKKRMLRHSMAEEGTLGGSSPKHEPRTSQESLTAPATPASQDEPVSEEAPILIQAKAELEPVQEEDSLFVTCSERMKSQFTLTFPLPARKDVRKNSSIDSGLSVTTPAELEKSPITNRAALEERLRDFSSEGTSGRQANKDASPELAAKTAECPVGDAKDTNDHVVTIDNNNLIKDESLKEDDESKDMTGNKEEIKLVENEENAKDEVDGTVSMEVDGRTRSPVGEKTLETNNTIDVAIDTSVKVPTSEQENTAVAVESHETAKPELLDESKNDDVVEKSKDLKNKLLTNVTRSDLNSLYVNSLRTRHVSGPGAMQGHKNESGPLTLTTSFADDHNVSSSSLYTPFSPKKRLLRQNTDPSERDAGLSMANSWPQQKFTSPQRFVSPKDESRGPNHNLSHKDTVTPTVGVPSSAQPVQGSPDRLSASWGSDVRPYINGQEVSPKKLDPGTTPSPSPSPGLCPSGAPAQGSVKPGTPPLLAVRNLGTSLSAAEGNQESTEVQTSQTTSSVSSSTTGGTASSGESAPNSAQSTPVKKKVSLLEYRKRRGSSVKPASSSSSSSATSTSTTTSTTSLAASLVATSTTGSGKLPLITLPNIPLPDIPPADPLKDEPGKKSSKAPTKLSSSSPSTTTPSLKTGVKGTPPIKNSSSSTTSKAGKPDSKSSAGFAIFSTKTKDGQTPTLTLTSEAQQVINSITSLLMEESHVHNGDVKDRTIRRSDSVPGDSRYSRRNYQDKPWEKDGRGDAAGSLKRPLSPEPPPPPPGKKLCTGPVPPPPPPKGAISREARPVENGPTGPLRQNSAPGGCVPGPVTTSSPLKNVSANAIPAQYGIAHRNQNPQYQMQYSQQPPQQQPQFATTTYHPHPTQQQAPQPSLPQHPQAAITQPQQQQQQQAPRPVPPPPVPPPQKHGNFNFQYNTQSTEKTSAPGFPQQQQQRVGYPTLPYLQNQNQINNHFGVQNKFPTNGRKSPYGSQDSNRQHTFYNRGKSNAYPAQKNFHAK
nr:inactive histone-lysine N-methyltransferase 2E-like isoform X1 [Lytechinus pictus]